MTDACRDFPVSFWETIARNRRWFALWVGVCLFLEIYFLIYPPRGLKATDVIALPNVRGSTLVNFPVVWNMLYHNDQEMLETMIEGGYIASATSEEALGLLHEGIRNNLSYSMLSDNLVSISFIQPRGREIRSFLSAFNKRMLEALDSMSREELNMRITRAIAHLVQLQRRWNILEQGFGISQQMAAEFLIQSLPLTSINEEEGIEIQHKIFESIKNFAANDWLSTFGYLALNELDISILQARMSLDVLTASSGAHLSMYPRETMVLTNPKAQPVPVQPFVTFFYLLIPLGCLCMCIGGLLIFKFPPFMTAAD